MRLNSAEIQLLCAADVISRNWTAWKRSQRDDPWPTCTTILMMKRRLVSYASYGSNLDAERFACYIAGGRPSGATRTYEGARDKSPPLDSVALTFPHQLYFSGESRIWGGSPAFIDTEPVEGVVCLFRAYLIGWGQFLDVVAQENGQHSGSIEIDDEDLVPGFSCQIGSGRYQNVLCIERFDDVPVVTFTSPHPMNGAAFGAPSAGYLATLIRGLRQSHDLNDEEMTSYLGSAPGCSRDAVIEALRLVERSGRGN
jgi:hypothetical protein